MPAPASTSFVLDIGHWVAQPHDPAQARQNHTGSLADMDDDVAVLTTLMGMPLFNWVERRSPETLRASPAT